MSLTGRVTSAELCAPLSGVRITVRPPQGEAEILATSDRDGAWQLPALAGDASVTFHKAGFASKRYPAAQLPGLVRLLEDHLIGYQTTLWFHPGDEVSAYVHAPTGFTATLYRHGQRKQHVLSLGEHPPCAQQVPDRHFVAEGLDWTPTLTYRIPPEARPGLYSLLLTAPGQEPFALPFVVSTPPGAYGQDASLLVLASTTTWQSYNLWGGRSRYRNFETAASQEYISVLPSALGVAKRWLRGLIPPALLSWMKRTLGVGRMPSEPWMFHRLSVRRPFTNCALEGEGPFRPFTNHLAGGEWRLLAWLEREGIPYDIVSGYDLHTSPDLLGHYRAMVISTHCEYWTEAMYEGVQHAHEQQGMWLLNLAGNTMYREIEFFEDGSTRCVSLDFHKSCADETQLLGVRFTEPDYGTCAPYKILRPHHWAFAGIPSSVKTFGGLSLNQNTHPTSERYDPGRPGVVFGLKGMGASGWEMDKLSKTAPNDIVRIAKGQNPGGGADMVARDPSGTRGGMFSASSVCFSGSLLIDYVASHIVANVIQRALASTGTQEKAA